MRKRLFFVLALMACGFASVWADEVTPEQAREIALKFMKSHSSRRAAPAMEQPVKVSGLYVFNVNNNGGFVIVSNDDETTPILGFSDSGSIDPDNMPSNMRAWLQGYADEIVWFQKNGITATPADNKARRRAPTHSHDAISELITTKWDQGRPYNLQCPFTNEYVIATGCLATAMAQVMYYTEKKARNNTTETTDVIPSYTWKLNGTNRATVAIPKDTEINWGIMRNTYTKTDVDESAQAVATLMKCCGYSVKMSYGSSSSAYLSDADDALINYFGYNETTVKYYKRHNYTYSSWVDMIYNELKEGRPVLYAGQAVDGGHAFVCDGYQYDTENQTDLFHINWGWSGQCDGLFVLSVLNPDQQGTGGSASNSAYTFGHEAIVGIQKASGTGTVQTPTAISGLNITINSITLSHSSIALGESVNAIINVTNNSQTNNFDGEICLYNGGKKAVGKMFEIAPRATADCIITFTPTATGTYSLNAKYPDITNGNYIESGVDDIELTVVDQTPTNLTSKVITPTTATFEWENVGGATSWNMRSRSATATIEDFNEFSTFNSNDYEENGWKRIIFSGGSSKLRLSDAGGIDGSKCLISPSYENNADVNPKGGLKSPKFSFGGTFSFFAWGSGEKFQIYLSYDGQNYTSISDVISAADDPTQYTFDLAEYANQEGYIAIIHCNSSGHTSDSYLYIDNVSFTESVGEWTTTNNVTSPHILSGLNAKTSYEVQVQAVNNDGGKWSNPVLFTTLAYPVPKDLTVSDVTPTSAKVTWTESDANSYDVRYAVRTEDYGSEATWLQYDNGTYKTNLGNNNKTEWTWGVMYPNVTRCKLTKVAFYETSSNTANITVNIYSGGETAPGTLLHTQVVTPLSQGIHEVTFDSSIDIPYGQNLWITLTEANTHPLALCSSTEPNNQWWLDGNTWRNISSLGISEYGWMIRGYIEPENVNWSEPINFTEQPPYKLTGLEHSKNYAVQVRGNYGSAGYSDWATVTFDKASGNLVLGNNNTNNAELIADWDGYHATAVTLTGRTLYKDGAWNTICLPFNVDSDPNDNVSFRGTPLEGAVVMELDVEEGSYEHQTSLNNGTLYLNFKSANSIVAGTPYIIKWPIDNDNPTIVSPVFSDDVTISKTMHDVCFAGGKFCGTYNWQQFDNNNTNILLIGVNNQGTSVLYYPKPDTTDPENPIYPTLGACRAYFQINDSGSGSTRSFVLNFGDNNNATGIIAIGNSQLSTLNSQLSDWYTLDGRKLNGKPTAKGVYVKNGKKIVIK